MWAKIADHLFSPENSRSTYGGVHTIALMAYAFQHGSSHSDTFACMLPQLGKFQLKKFQPLWGSHFRRILVRCHWECQKSDFVFAPSLESAVGWLSKRLTKFFDGMVKLCNEPHSELALTPGYCRNEPADSRLQTELDRFSRQRQKNKRVSNKTSSDAKWAFTFHLRLRSFWRQV